ncbi:Kunitz-type serine protease inhibitor ki-VN [Fasciola hepatica]|uniref:Kunitz-type serine protease inhibitor ki-VN n=1 Tax=Fasciola hepatica TaxID=6192 RepID=A0A4E0RVC1_FASHE|nr:Kunitz-type serine protease inhibitor ki-VN [Fasciola hepatica]
MKLSLIWMVVLIISLESISSVYGSKEGRCYLPRVTGPCRGSFPSYGYNPQTGACERFIYGGCRGNANRFKTLEECRRVCHAK